MEASGLFVFVSSHAPFVCEGGGGKSSGKYYVGPTLYQYRVDSFTSCYCKTSIVLYGRVIRYNTFIISRRRSKIGGGGEGGEI